MSKSKLRNPTPAERKAGLPKTKKEAIKQGINRFIPADGEERTIRNYGSNSFPNGQVQLSSSRKSNRGGSYSHSSGTREFNKHLASPAGSDFEAADRAIQKANTAGMDGDHTQDLARTAEGKRFKVQSGRGTVQEYDARFAKANVPIGHTEGNIKPLLPEVNQQVKPAELRAMDNGIARADGGKYVFEQLKRSLGFTKGKNVMAGAANFSASLLGFAPELMEIADNYTDGKASEVVDGAINGVVQGAINGYKNAAENYKNGDNFSTM